MTAALPPAGHTTVVSKSVILQAATSLAANIPHLAPPSRGVRARSRSVRPSPNVRISASRYSIKDTESGYRHPAGRGRLDISTALQRDSAVQVASSSRTNQGGMVARALVPVDLGKKSALVRECPVQDRPWSLSSG